jgi:hypothetical protein
VGHLTGTLTLFSFFVLAAWTGLGCGSGVHGAASSDVVPTEVPVPSDLSAIPAMPSGTLLQLTWRSTGRVDRFMDDGRWLLAQPGVAESPQKPMSRIDRGVDKLTPAGVGRIRATLDKVGFFGLPSHVAGTPPPAGAVLTGGQGAFKAQSFALSAFDPKGDVKTVEIEGDFRAFDSFGLLAPLFRQLDIEAWGGWQYE